MRRVRSADDLPQGARPADNGTGADVPAPPEPPERARQRYWADRLAAAERPADSRAGLLDRARGLPVGHPSSPWDEGGSPRQPAPGLADFEITGDADRSQHGDDFG
jgi:hypothetical protein